MKLWRGGIALAAVSFVMFSTNATAYAAPSVDTHCAVLVSKSQLNADGSSKVLNQSCAPTMDAAVAGMLSAADRVGVASSTVLMTWFSGTYLSGSSTVIYGDAGTCDSTGYRVRTNNYWEVNLSSVRRAGNCNYAQVVTPIPSSYAYRCLTMNVMPSGFNNNTAQVNPRYVVSCY